MLLLFIQSGARINYFHIVITVRVVSSALGNVCSWPVTCKNGLRSVVQCPLQVQEVKLLICLTPGFFYSVFLFHGGMRENAMVALFLSSRKQGRHLVSFYIPTQVLRSNPWPLVFRVGSPLGTGAILTNILIWTLDLDFENRTHFIWIMSSFI